MKQVILLEEREVARLMKGKQLEIQTGNGTLLIGFDQDIRKQVAQTKVDRDEETICTLCDPPREFRNKHGLNLHRTKKHPGRRRFPARGGRS